MTHVVPIVGVLSLLVAMIALTVNIRNAQASRVDSENKAIVEIWAKYEAICTAIADAKSGKSKDLAFGSMVNYIENTCLLINKKRFTPNIERAARRMSYDFLDSLEKHAPIEAVLTKIDDTPHAFCEIRNFMRQRQKPPRVVRWRFWRKVDDVDTGP